MMVMMMMMMMMMSHNDDDDGCDGEAEHRPYSVMIYGGNAVVVGALMMFTKVMTMVGRGRTDDHHQHYDLIECLYSGSLVPSATI